MRYEKNISKSFLQSYMEYAQQRECGLRFKAINIDKTLKPEPSEAMNLGNYFEYMATGYCKDNEPPLPKRTQKGEKTAEYKRADIQAENFKAYCDALGIQILETGKRIERDGCSLVLDVVALYKERECVIDLKYTGLLYNKWEENGWALDGFEYKQVHHIQPMHYCYMTGLPFYYFVFSSSNEIDCEFFEVILPQPQTSELHANRIERMRDRIGLEMQTGFIARPELKRCTNCELFAKCEHAAKAPEQKEVHIQPQFNPTLDNEV